MSQQNRTARSPRLTLLSIGTILFVLYYLADCALDSLVFGEGTFYGHLFSPSPHELAIRILSGSFLFALYLVSTILMNKNKALQCDLLEKSQKIVESNRELDTYHHILSHDLKHLSTRIMLTNERLRFDCFQNSSSRANELLTSLGDDCARLSDRIEDMVRYSETSRALINKQRVAIDNIAREIAKDLSGSIRNQILEMHIDNNLETDCDPGLMQIALKNLISCSIGHADHQQSAIRFGMKKRRNVPIYFIRPDKNHGRQDGRLPVNTPQTTNLVNIQTARNIIERHGGQLWARDASSSHPSFYFTI